MSITIIFIASEIDCGRKGSNKTQLSPRISVMGRLFEHAIGNPDAIASSNMFGKFSQVEAKMKPSDL